MHKEKFKKSNAERKETKIGVRCKILKNKNKYNLQKICKQEQNEKRVMENKTIIKKDKCKKKKIKDKQQEKHGSKKKTWNGIKRKEDGQRKM